MMKNKAGWVALIVLAIATVLMIFFVLPNLKGIEETAKAPATTDAKPADTVADEAKGARPGTDATDQGTQAAGDGTQASGAAATPSAEKPADAASQSTTQAQSPTQAKPAAPALSFVAPGFDVLRVEPDGSTVIAGHAQPDTKLEIIDGDNKVIGTADVASTGDFAAVFDDPLAPGDYQLTLRSVGKDGAAKSSEEVATVSIPKDKSGELLAMVSKPGEASRIITKPVAEQAAATQAKPADTAAATPPAADATAAQTQTSTAAPADAIKPAAGASATDTNVANTAPANTTPSTTAPASTATPASAMTSPISVSAVEIEGRKMFVAGSAKPGAMVRIYADDRLLGEIKADAQGHFLVDGVLDLPVGSHTIRADMLSADGGKVDFRAAVPFDRPAGDQVAAVAQAGATGAMASFDGGSFDGLRMEATKAFALLKGLFAGGKTPSAEQLAAARSATQIALNSLADFKVADTTDAGVRDLVSKTAKAAGDAVAMLKALPQDPASVGAALGKIETAIGSTLMPRTDGAGATAVQTPAPATTPDTTTAQDEAAKPAPATTTAQTTAPAAETAEPAADATKPSAETAEPSTTPGTTTSGAPASAAPATADTGARTAPATAAGEPETVQQAPLQESKSSVIIRRGDTLWQISRRVYGAGVRYTTIYLANEDQITNPDRILPGQIFGVPDKAMPEGESEEIHRKRVTHSKG